MTGGRDFSLSAPVAPERNYRKYRTKNKGGRLKFVGARCSRAKQRDLNETWPRLQFVGARSSKAMWPRLKGGRHDKRHPQ